MDNEKAWFVRRVVLSVLFLVIVAVPLYPELFGLDEVTPFAQLAAFRPQGLVVVLLLALLMLVRRGWRIAAVLVASLALVGGALVAPRRFSDARPAPAGSRVLTIMVANVLGGGARAADVAQVIRDRKPDLVSLPEAQVDVREEIPPELSTPGGGEIATKQDPKTNTAKPITAVYEVIIPLENPGLTLQPGLRGFAKIDGGYSSLGWWLWRLLTKTFHFTL